jgi:hypothetical protein
MLTGVAAGLVLGVQDALTRVTVGDLGSWHKAAGLLTSWPAYCLIAVGATGLWLMQNAFNSAPLHASLPGITAAEPVSGIILGVVAFRDKVPSSPLLIALQVGGVVALVTGVVMVARAPALASLSSKAHLPRPPRPGGLSRRRRPQPAADGPPRPVPPRPEPSPAPPDD